MDNLEYKDIVYYIENDILNTRLINNSRIIETQGGGMGLFTMFNQSKQSPGNFITNFASNPNFSIIIPFLPSPIPTIYFFIKWAIYILQFIGVDLNINNIFSGGSKNKLVVINIYKSITEKENPPNDMISNTFETINGINEFFKKPEVIGAGILFASYMFITTKDDDKSMKNLYNNTIIFILSLVLVYFLLNASTVYYTGLYFICFIGVILYIKTGKLPVISLLLETVKQTLAKYFTQEQKQQGGVFNYLKSTSWSILTFIPNLLTTYGSYFLNKISYIYNWLMGNKIETIEPPEELIELMDLHSEQEKELVKIPDLIREKFVNKFSFNKNTGLIEFNDTITDINSIITSIADINSLNINHIFMITNRDKITFKINNETLENDINNLSIIDNKPIHLALVMAYIFSKNDNVKLESYQEKCKTIFGSYTENICAKHIYSVLGKSSISMLNNLGVEINSSKLEQNLLNADIEILYEILKNLNWKFKITSKKQHLVDVDEWNKIVNSDYIELYDTYFRQHNNIRILLNNIVTKINNNSDFINKKSEMIKNRNVEHENHDKIKPRKKTL